MDVEKSFLESCKKAKVFFSFSSEVHFEAVFTYTAEELDPRSAICWSQWEVKNAQNHALIANLAWRYVLCPTKKPVYGNHPVL